MTQPTIVKEGNDPHCVHHEVIKNNIGVCTLCEQGKDYTESTRFYNKMVDNKWSWSWAEAQASRARGTANGKKNGNWRGRKPHDGP